jgi:hypothetical protein
MSLEPYDEEGVFIDEMDGVDDFGDFHDARYGQVSGNASSPSIHYVNESGLPDEVIDRHFRRGKFGMEAASIIEKWSQSLNQPQSHQTLDMFNRNKFEDNALHMHAVMSRCAWAVENDDVLSTLADVVEGLMWQKCRFELIDQDQQDMWNQWAADVDLDGQLRKMGREEFKVSQFYVGLLWERRIYSVNEDQIEEQIEEMEAEKEKYDAEKRLKAREEYIAANKGVEGFVMPPEIPVPEDNKPGRGNRKRKKKFPVVVPTEMTIFDPTKILPVGQLMFGRERFAYIATREEHEAFKQVMRGDSVDGMVLRMIERQYEPTGSDRAICGDLGVDADHLWLFKEDSIFRHSLTRADYERYAPVRLKPILPILEMKGHLRASDRASLIGNTNFIVVITKGTDRLPAKPAEIANLQEQARVIARMPVLVGDHRLKVEIVSPSLDNTLMPTRWDNLDSRLVFAALRTYAPVIQGGNSSGTGMSEMSMVVAKGLESRRHMIVRTLEKQVFKKILDRNENLDESPDFEFTPKRITLDFDSDVVNAILKLRDRGDISRETALEELDYDQDREVLRRARERVLHDRVFESSTPFSSPNANPYGTGQPGGINPGALQAPPQMQAPKSNVGPNGQPRTEGGRPPGVKEDAPRRAAKKTTPPK